jgi:hypothetical protein
MNSTDLKRPGLVLAALFLGGAVPIQLVTLSFGYSQYARGESLGPKVIRTAHEFGYPYFVYLLIPSLILLAAIAIYSRRHHPDLYRRILVGMAAGAVATVALDFFRQMGVIHGWLPGDTPMMFGKMVTGSNDFSVFYPVGTLVHFLNGADFGLVFALVWGRRATRSRTVMWALFWAILVEMGMMIGPPMGPMVGLFGVRFAWPQLFLLTLAAHVGFGTVLGLLTHHWLPEDGRSVIGFVTGAEVPSNDPLLE